jgi:hypothetical protein
MGSEKIVSKNPLEANKIKSHITTFIMVSIVLFFLAGVAQAEATKTVRDLKSEPASMLDLGLVRLENLLRKNQPATIDVSYDYERNKILIRVVRINRMSRGEKNRSKDDLRRLIQQDVLKIRQDLNVNPVTGEIQSGYTALENCFRHADAPKERGATNLRDELYHMTEISAKVIVDRDEAAVEARVPLKGNRIEWIK